jgi:8-oxo-dGTP diphosphatase
MTGAKIRVMAGAIVARGTEASGVGFVKGFEAPIEGAVLLARRRPELKMGGFWELPGGKLEAGETEREALARELVEELGLEVEVGDYIASGVSGVVVLEGYLCRLRAGVVGEVAKDHDAFAWVSAAQVGEFETPPADVPILAAWARMKVGR